MVANDVVAGGAGMKKRSVYVWKKMVGALKNNKKHLIKILVSLVLLAIFLKWIGLYSSFVHLRSIHWGYILFGAVLFILVHLTKALRFHLLAASVGERVDIARNVLAHMIAPVVGLVTPGRMGEGFKVFLFRKSRKSMGFCFLIEKAMESVLLLIICLFGVFLFTEVWVAVIIFAAMFAIGVVILLNIDRLLNVVFRKNTFEKGWFWNNARRMDPWLALASMIISAVIWFFNFAALYMYALAVGLDMGFISFSLIFAMAALVGIVSGLPGGIGSREFSLTFLAVTYYGIDKAYIGAFSLASLFLSYSILGLMALVAYIIFRYKGYER